MPAPRAARRRSALESSRFNVSENGEAPDMTFERAPLTTICKEAIGVTGAGTDGLNRGILLFTLLGRFNLMSGGVESGDL